jgi:glycosyltransferase involved in cell wall biosynthesis
VPIALDATYSLGRNLSGVGVYSREILLGLARAHPEEEFLWCYRAHRFVRSYRERLPKNVVRRLLAGRPPGDVFHALNQRIDSSARRNVATFHDLFVITGEYSTPEFRARFTDQARRAAERSDLVIAVSQFTASQIEQHLNVPASRIRVVPHGAHLAQTTPEPARENLVLFVGAIQKRKNIARLVKAFERLPGSWRLALAGAADGYGAAEELHAVQTSARRGSIDVLGHVSDEALESLYRHARIFAFPSLDEGFGMPVLEAMAHGVPVIASTAAALPEVAGDAAVLVDPFDVEAIGDAMSRLACSGSEREELMRRGLDRVRSFTWETAVARTWAVYDELR